MGSFIPVVNGQHEVFFKGQAFNTWMPCQKPNKFDCNNDKYDPRADMDTCWKRHDSKYSSAYVNGNSQKYELPAAKAKCMHHSGKCKAITCKKGDLTACTLREGSEMKDSQNEVTFTPECSE